MHGGPAHESVHHRDIAVLSATRTRGGVERDHDRKCGIERTATEIADLESRHRRAAALTAAEHQDAGDGRIVEVVSGTVAKRSILAITADAAEHDPGIDLSQGCVADAETIHHAGAKTLDDDIG